MTRRTTIAAAAAGLSALTLAAGCSSSSSTGSAGTSTSPSAGASTDSTASTAPSPSTSGAAGSAGGALGKVVYIPGLTGNPFYNTVSCGAKTEAAKQGVGFSYQGAPTFGVAEQTKILNAVVATKPGAIMISITDPTAMIAPLTAAKQAGIKIIGIDGDLNDKSIMTTNIQADGVQGGKLAGEALAGATGGKGTVLIIDNATGSVVSKARTDGFSQAIGTHPGMKVLPIQYSGNDVSKAASIVSAAAARNSDLVGVFGAETNNSEGALTGVREAGKRGKVKVVGYDTSEPIVAALKDGTMTGTVVQYPRGEGSTGVDSAVAAMKGTTVERDQAADSIFVTPATVGSPKAKQYIYDVNCTS